jgi:hypothetical protein
MSKLNVDEAEIGKDAGKKVDICGSFAGYHDRITRALPPNQKSEV